MSKKITIRADKGSTMSNLAEILGTTVEELKKYNNLDSNIVKVGQEFSWETDDIEGIKTRLSKVQNRLQQKRQAIIDAENKKKADENAKRNMQWIESKRQDYGDLTQHQIRDYQNFVKSGKGKTIADFKAYKEKESKDARSTRDLTLKAGQGIVGMAGLTSLGTTVLPPIINSAPVQAFIANPIQTTKNAAIGTGKFVAKNAPGLIRDMAIYETVIDPTTEAIADASGLQGTSRQALKYGLGFGASGITSKILDRGTIAGLQYLRNSLDDLASRGSILGKKVTAQSGKNLTKAANFVENVQNQATKVMDPLRTLNAKEAGYDLTSAFFKNSLGGIGFGTLEEHNPVGATIAAPLTTMLVSRGTHGIKRLAGINSKGQKSASQIMDKISQRGTPYQGFLHTTRSSNRLANGQKAAFSGVDLKGGMQDVAHTPNGIMPLMYKWTSVHKGNTYKSPYWEQVNPQRFVASKLMAPYEGTGWMARRSFGDTMDFFSPQSFDEFVDVAQHSYNKEGQSMYNWLRDGNLKYDIAHEGDLILARNSNKLLTEQELQKQLNKNKRRLNKGKSPVNNEVEPLIIYNQNGNRQSSQTFKTPDGTDIHLGSDFGGTGSGGNAEAHASGLKGWLVGRLKSSMDLGSYSLPVTGQIQRAIRTKAGKFTTNNVEAYHKNGLPVIDANLSQKKLFHFNKQGGKLLPNIIGL